MLGGLLLGCEPDQGTEGVRSTAELWRVVGVQQILSAEVNVQHHKRGSSDKGALEVEITASGFLN